MIAAVGTPLRAEVPYQTRVYSLPSGAVRNSVALGDLNGDGIDDIVVGSVDGVVSAYRGNGTRLWSFDTGNATIESKAAIGDINKDGHNEVVIGIGGTLTPGASGAVVALSHDGRQLWRHSSGDFNGDGISDAVYASPALADVDGNDGGRLEIIYGGYDGYVHVLNDNGSVVWENFYRDTIWSSPSLGDIDKDGKLEIVIGSDSHDEPGFNLVAGGRLLAINAENGTMVPGFPISVNEVIWSSPVLADMTGDGWLDIIVGTGDCWTNPACAVPTGNVHPVTNALYGWDHTGHALPGWPVMLSDNAVASPSVADIDRDGKLEAVINTQDGYVYVIEHNGAKKSGWPVLVTTPAGPGTVVHFATWASPVLADLTGDGISEVILPSNWELVVFDLSGHQLTRDSFPSSKWALVTEYTLSMSPAVGDVDGDGKVEVVAGGARTGGATGAIYIWDFGFAAKNEGLLWPFSRLDSHNRASYSAMPDLRVSAASSGITLLAEAGTSTSTGLWIASTELVPLNWSISNVPSRVSLSKTSGSVGIEGTSVKVNISVSDLSVGPHTIGTMVVNGTYNNETVPSSPVYVPIKVIVVRDLHQVHLPFSANH